MVVLGVVAPNAEGAGVVVVGVSESMPSAPFEFELVVPAVWTNSPPELLFVLDPKAEPVLGCPPNEVDLVANAPNAPPAPPVPNADDEFPLVPAVLPNADAPAAGAPNAEVVLPVPVPPNEADLLANAPNPAPPVLDPNAEAAGLAPKPLCPNAGAAVEPPNPDCPNAGAAAELPKAEAGEVLDDPNADWPKAGLAPNPDWPNAGVAVDDEPNALPVFCAGAPKALGCDVEPPNAVDPNELVALPPNAPEPVLEPNAPLPGLTKLDPPKADV